MHMENNNNSILGSAVDTFCSKLRFGNRSSYSKVGRFAYGRQLALHTFLPKWEGFIVSTSPDSMGVKAALKRIHQVWNTIVNANVIRHGADNAEEPWHVEGFNEKSVECNL